MSSPGDASAAANAASEHGSSAETTPLLLASASPFSVGSPPMVLSTSARSVSYMPTNAVLSPSVGSNTSTPRAPSSRSGKPMRVGLDAAVVHNQQKWKRLADISDDNSTAKDMASEVQQEFMKQRQQNREKLQQQQKRQQQQQMAQLAMQDLEGDDQTSFGASDAQQPPLSRSRTESNRENLNRSMTSDYGSPLMQEGGATTGMMTMEADKYLIAAAFVRDGIHGRKIGYRLDRTALFLNELFHSDSYRGIYMLVASISCLLAFAEQPGDQNAYLFVDLLCLVMFAIDIALRWYMSSEETKRKFISRQPWAYVRMVLLVITASDIAINLLFPAFNPNRYSRALRPYFLITRGRNIRIIFASCLRALREVIVILLLMGCLIGFFGLLGYLVFSDYSNSTTAPYFFSLSSSMYTMLLIHNCLPYMVKSMYPYYKLTHWSSIFFIIFVLLTNLFLMKLTIAASYRSYKQHTEKMLYKRLQKRKAALYAAFDILAQDINVIEDHMAAGDTLSGSGGPRKLARGSSRYFLGPSDADRSSFVSQSAPMMLTPMQQRRISIESWIHLCAFLKSNWTVTEARLVFNTVDIHHIEYLDLGDFYQLCSLLNVKVEHTAKNSMLKWIFTSTQYYKIKKLRVRMRNILLHETILFGKYPVVVAELVVGMLICLSVLQAIQVNNIELAFSVNRSWRIFGFFLLILFTLEVVLKLFAFGRIEFFLRPFCRLDLAIVSVGWLFYILTSMRDPPSISLTLYDLALAVRSLRVLKLLNMFPPFHEILWTMKRIAALIVQLLLVIFCVMYSFAIFTQANYGLAFRDFPPEKASLSPNWYAVREEFQVDTFEETLVTLFGVANLAGWDMVMDAAHAITGSDSTYVFFFCYRIAMANILLPIFVGFLVESFVSNAKAVEDTYQTYVEAAEERALNQQEEEQMTLLQSKEIPASPVSCSSDGELRIKYQRRGSLVHNQMFDAVKISDVSRLTLLVEKKDEEIAQQEMTIRQLESNVLGMQSRVGQSHRVILQYEAKMEELSAALQEAKEQIEQQQKNMLDLERAALEAQQERQPLGTRQSLSSSSRRGSWRVWNA
uniref:Ion transport domain-containing protein n=1 Tax=Globisporangium ultimum (strain ATCC 200006 / CBS 805.95 / DAOM BR144) TaxID=431595 RepID=K3X7Q9_GLOUD